MFLSFIVNYLFWTPCFNEVNVIQICSYYDPSFACMQIYSFGYLPGFPWFVSLMVVSLFSFPFICFSLLTRLLPKLYLVICQTTLKETNAFLTRSFNAGLLSLYGSSHSKFPSRIQANYLALIPWLFLYSFLKVNVTL